MHGTLTMHQFYVHFCIVQELVSPLGLVINIAKCEVYSLNDLSMFPSEMRRSNVPHLEALGSPIGDAIFCANFLSQTCTNASKLLSQLVDLQVALLLLRMCGTLIMH